MASIRTLEPADLNDLLALSEAAQWNQTGEDWLRLLRLQPQGCFGIEMEGRIIASTTVVLYEDDVAWVGMVLTHPAHRGQGHARRLMEHAHLWLSERGIWVIGLDASDQGEALYRSLGYEPEYLVERWKRDPKSLHSSTSSTFTHWHAPDWPDNPRKALLRDLAGVESFCLPGKGYCFARPGRVAHFIGPLMADTPQTAFTLLQEPVRRYSPLALFLDVAPEHESARRLAEQFDFRPARRLLRMVRGAAPRLPVPTDYFGAGFEFG